MWKSGQWTGGRNQRFLWVLSIPFLSAPPCSLPFILLLSLPSFLFRTLRECERVVNDGNQRRSLLPLPSSFLSFYFCQEDCCGPCFHLSCPLLILRRLLCFAWSFSLPSFSTSSSSRLLAFSSLSFLHLLSFFSCFVPSPSLLPFLMRRRRRKKKKKKKCVFLTLLSYSAFQLSLTSFDLFEAHLCCSHCVLLLRCTVPSCNMTSRSP